MPSGILHVLELKYSIYERENVGDDTPTSLSFSHVQNDAGSIIVGATYKKAVENTSTSWFRLDLVICSFAIAGIGKMKMYRSRMIPSADCTIPQ